MSHSIKIYSDVLQGSELWHELRNGRPTASQASRIITAARGEYSKSAGKYAQELVAELLAPNESPRFIGNYATDRGNEMEPLARKAFAATTGSKLATVGFISGYQDIVGLSPDALIIADDDLNYAGGLEIKCPLRAQHVENCVAGELPDEYKQQVHWSLAVTGFPEWHFYSWHPEMMPVHYVVYPDEYTLKVKSCIEQFLIEYADLRARLIPILALNQPPNTNKTQHKKTPCQTP